MRTFAAILCVVMVAPVCLRAQEAAPEPHPERTRGKILFLDGERTLEGDIERLPDGYRIRKNGGEIRLPLGKTQRLCADWNDALNYLKSRANLGDPDERLRLARWCQMHHLHEQALAEARAAQIMRPEHAPTNRYLEVLRKLDRVADNPAATPKAAGSAPAVAVDLASESIIHFRTRVQPILMNTCARCHTAGRGGNFHLFRGFEGGDRGALRKNLASVLAQVDLARPKASPLLIKAISAHGLTDQPPIQGRQTPPFQTLEHWVLHTLATNPHLRPADVAAEPVFGPMATPAPMPAPSSTRPVVVSRTVPAAPPAAATQKAATPATAADGSPPPGMPPETPMAPEPTVPTASGPQAGDDPFDPADFNRRK